MGDPRACSSNSIFKSDPTSPHFAYLPTLSWTREFITEAQGAALRFLSGSGFLLFREGPDGKDFKRFFHKGKGLGVIEFYFRRESPFNNVEAAKDLAGDNAGPLAELWNLDKGCWVATRA